MLSEKFRRSMYFLHDSLTESECCATMSRPLKSFMLPEARRGAQILMATASVCLSGRAGRWQELHQDIYLVDEKDHGAFKSSGANGAIMRRAFESELWRAQDSRDMLFPKLRMTLKSMQDKQNK